jgi:hypothetical protein
MTDYAAVLTVLAPGASWSMSGNDLSTLEWYDDTVPPTQAELDAAWPQVQWQQEHDAVRETRQHLYATETDPMFFEVQRGEGTATLQDWKDAVQAIKDAHPFPTDVD